MIPVQHRGATSALLALLVVACSRTPSGTTAAFSNGEARGTAGNDAFGSGGSTTDVSGAFAKDAEASGGSARGGTLGAGGSSGSAASDAGSTAARPGTIDSNEPVSDTLYVDGRHLRDRCGEKLVLRGVNEMIVWSAGRDGIPEFAEIAKTGANAVRIVWTDEGSAGELDTAISNAVAEELVPMVEHHGATGEIGKVPQVVDYWTAADVVSVLKKHSAYLLLNIANEAADEVTQHEFETTYQQAITRIRDAGIRVPLIVDAPNYGHNIDMLQATWSALARHDAERNVLFSVHMWWADPSGARVKAELEQSVAMDLPLIVGEFAQHAFTGCDENPFNYRVLLDEAQKHEIGWLAWSWGSVSNRDCAGRGSFDMTTNGTFGSWEEDWGRDVALDHVNGIHNTSVRPASLTKERCSP